MWWAAALVVWLVSAAGIVSICADVFRGKSAPFSGKLIPWYGFHGVTAILALWLLQQALGG